METSHKCFTSLTYAYNKHKKTSQLLQKDCTCVTYATYRGHCANSKTKRNLTRIDPERSVEARRDLEGHVFRQALQHPRQQKVLQGRARRGRGRVCVGNHERENTSSGGRSVPNR